jgi:hypothetical protein
VLAGQAVETSGVAVRTGGDGGVGGDRQQTDRNEGTRGEANPHHGRTVQTPMGAYIALPLLGVFVAISLAERTKQRAISSASATR